MGDAWIYSTGAANDELVRLLAELGFSPRRVRRDQPVPSASTGSRCARRCSR